MPKELKGLTKGVKMAKVILNKEARQADRIIRCLPRQTEVASRLGISRQLARYRIKNVYPSMIVELINVLDLAGYQITEKE